MMRSQGKSLGELLRQAGKITSRQIQVALAEQKKSHEPIGKVLVQLGFVEERDILQVMEGMMVLTFAVEKEWYGIETFRVREVLKWAALEAKNFGGHWEGTFKLRGVEVPVLSFRKFLGIPGEGGDKGTWFIVLEKKGRPFILWVDMVREVARLKTDQIETLPAYLLGRRNELYYCLGNIKGDFYSILNPDKLVEDSRFLLPEPEVKYAIPS